MSVKAHSGKLCLMCLAVFDVFDVCGCGRSVRCTKIEKFLSLRKRNHLPQPQVSNAARVNEP